MEFDETVEILRGGTKFSRGAQPSSLPVETALFNSMEVVM